MPRIAIALLTFGIIGSASLATADPIRLTQGALTGGDFSASLHAQSADGRFVIDGFGDRAGGIYAPAESCNTTPDCRPGMTLSLQALWNGSDFPGTAVVDGASYALSGGNQANAQVSFTGTWQAPAFDGHDHARAVAPFLFEGLFFYPSGLGTARGPLSLVGRGTATLHLLRNANGSWTVNATRYQFSDGASATPEPMSLCLLASGAAGLFLRKRRS